MQMSYFIYESFRDDSSMKIKGTCMTEWVKDFTYYKVWYLYANEWFHMILYGLDSHTHTIRNMI